MAGIVTAYYLTREGVSCVVVERDHVASHASGFAYGGIGHLGRSGSPGPNHHVAALSAVLHAELKDALVRRDRYRHRISHEARHISSLHG